MHLKPHNYYIPKEQEISKIILSMLKKENIKKIGRGIQLMRPACWQSVKKEMEINQSICVENMSQFMSENHQLN
jgi:hypothetical protein